MNNNSKRARDKRRESALIRLQEQHRITSLVTNETAFINKKKRQLNEINILKKKLNK